MKRKRFTAEFKSQAIKQTLTISNSRHELTVVSDAPMLGALGEHLSFTGAKYACDIAQCGYFQPGQIMSATAS